MAGLFIARMANHPVGGETWLNKSLRWGMEAKAITAMVCLSEGMTLTIHITQMTALEIQMLKQQVAQLSKDEKFQFQTEFTSRRRNAGTGIALALLLGCFGAHKFYMKQNTAGVLYAIGGTIGWALIVPGWIVVILSIIDACGMGNTAQKVNRDVAVDLRREIEAFRD